ncbi:MAG: hypothetical protein V4754_00420 [Pseudomonadota bacterium]
MTARTGWIVTISPDRAIADVAMDLARAGLMVDQVLEQMACITGRATPEVAAAFSAIRGVAAVAAAQGVDLEWLERPPA